MDAEQLLKQCRFSKRYQGYQCLIECIRIASEDEEKLLYVTEIYTDVAQKFNISWKSVERNIRTAFDYSWKNGGKEQLELLAGGTFYEKPTVGEIIEIFTCYIRAHCNDC